MTFRDRDSQPWRSERRDFGGRDDSKRDFGGGERRDFGGGERSYSRERTFDKPFRPAEKNPVKDAIKEAISPEDVKHIMGFLVEQAKSDLDAATVLSEWLKFAYSGGWK